ncbi:MAG: hypothetical protein D8H99_33660 [Streptococcus sp.]|nr:MAG: hypothetical protein D8H99_33660 [Streptococcus sp.]
MIFRNFSDYLNTSNQFFLGIPTVNVGSVSVIQMNSIEFPSVSSSCSIMKKEAFLKLYSEYLERSALASNYQNTENIKCFDLLSGKINILERGHLSYGKNFITGYCDTTGTSSNPFSSSNSVKKAIAELIEKNELIFFWYLNLGEKIDINDSKVKSLIGENLLANYEIFLFKIGILSSWFTVIGILFKDGQVVSTGICCNENYKCALEGAIQEMKILRVLNSYKLYSNFPLTPEEQNIIYKKICHFENKIISSKLKKVSSDLNLSINEMISDLNIAILSRNKFTAVVSVYSSSLIKCLPIKENLMKCVEVDIVKKIGINSIINTPDCIVL